MKRPFRLLAAGALALLTSCSGLAVNEVYLLHNLPHGVAFTESPCVYAAGNGSGTVRGQLYLFNKDGSKFYGAEQDVSLLPVTDYTTEIVHREYAHGAYLSRPDPRLAKYVRTAQTDDAGNFQFSHLPPGNYYVATKFAWDTPDTIYDGDNNPTEVTSHNSRKAYAEVSIRNGQTATITDWIDGPERFR